MYLRTLGIALLGAFAALPAWAATDVAYGPPPAWVKPADIPDLEPSKDAGAVQTLLFDSQALYGADADELYSERAYRISSALGLRAANLIAAWDPQTTTVTIHRLHLIRDGKVTDLLAGDKKFTVLRREQNLEAAMLDGTLTATFQPEDVRVGDVIDFVYSVRRHDPVVSQSEGQFAVAHPGVAGRVRIRQLWPDARAMRWKASADLPAPTLSHADGRTELLLDMQNVLAPKKPSEAPQRFRRLGLIEATNASDFSDISRAMAPLFDKASRLRADSPLLAEVAKIRASTNDPKDRAYAALRLVQNQTRYVFLAMNFGGLTPADADVTWERRFGDCKAKTALLLALLNALDIKAQPALVSTQDGDGLDQRMPMMGLFDHVIVRASIAGKTYWLDGTRPGDADLDHQSPPDYHWALPVQTSGARLEKLEPAELREPDSENLISIDGTAGTAKPAPVHAESITRGVTAIVMNAAYANMTQADRDRAMRSGWTDDLPWVKPDKVAYSYDEKAGVFRLLLDGTGSLEWKAVGQGFEDFSIDDSDLGYNASFQREPGPNDKAPFKVSYPDFRRYTFTVRLPDNGAGYLLTGAPDLDKTIAGVAYRRTSRIEKGVAVVQTEQRSLAPEFPSADAPAAAAELRAMGGRIVTLRSRSGATRSASNEDLTTPVNAAGFSARGATYLSHADYDKAIADFTRAMELDGRQAKYVYNRGAAYFQKGDDARALADFNRALELDPQDVFALMARGELNLVMKRPKPAAQDFAAALKDRPLDAKLLLQRARAYEFAGAWPEAIGFYDDWLKAFPDDDDRATVLGRRCAAKAKAGRDLTGAQDDCAASLKSRPRNADGLEGAGLLALRRNQPDEAVNSYSAWLAIEPNEPTALYGRGLGQSRKGLTAEATRDFDAAKAIQGDIAATFKAYGLPS